MPRYISSHDVTLGFACGTGSAAGMAGVYFWRAIAAPPMSGGVTWIVVLGCISLVVTLVALAVTGARGLHGDGPKGWLLAAVGGALAAVPAWFVAGFFLTAPPVGSPELRSVWRTPVQANDLRSLAIWQQGETVVRVREDGLYAYRAGDGSQAWTLPLPPRESVCSASNSPAESVAVIGVSRSLGACESVRAVDLTTGRWTWGDRVVKIDSPVEKERQYHQLAVADGTVLIAEEDQLRALRLTDGGELWRSPVSKECENQAVAAAGRKVALIEYCSATYPQGRAALRVFGTADGRQAWTSDLRTETALDELDILSVRPLVVRVEEHDTRGVRGLQVFSEQGAPGALIPSQGADLSLALTGNNNAISAPGLRAMVTGDQLLAAVKLSGSTEALAAFSLTDGSRRWLVDAGDGLYAAAAGQDDVLALTDYGYDSQLLRIDPRTGETRSRTVLPELGSSRASTEPWAWLGETATRYLIGYSASYASTPALRGLPR